MCKNLSRPFTLLKEGVWPGSKAKLAQTLHIRQFADAPLKY